MVVRLIWQLLVTYNNVATKHIPVLFRIDLADIYPRATFAIFHRGFLIFMFIFLANC